MRSPDVLAAAAFIARKDLALVLRQRETILWVFVMPFLFFYFIGTVIGGAGSGGDERDPLVLERPAAADAVVDELASRLEQQRYRLVTPSATEELGRFDRRVTITPPPDGRTVTQAVLAGEPTTVRLELHADPLAASFDEFRVARATYTLVADLAVLRSEGREVTTDAFKQLAAEPRRLTLTVRPAGRREDPPRGFSQAVPGIMVMFTMLVLLTSGAVMLLVEREHGLLARLASAPISRGSIVLGKWTARMTLALVQLAFAMLIGRVVFGVDWGPSLVMVALVMIAWAAFNASLSLLLANVARTHAQIIGIGVLASMVLAALGGAWWPIEITPDWMKALAMALPSGWTMDALHQLVSFGYGASSAAPHVAALTVTALALGWASARVFKYQ